MKKGRETLRRSAACCVVSSAMTGITVTALPFARWASTWTRSSIERFDRDGDRGGPIVFRDDLHVGGLLLSKAREGAKRLTGLASSFLGREIESVHGASFLPSDYPPTEIFVIFESFDW